MSVPLALPADARRRMWVGPVLLVFLITFVYLFSVVPRQRPVSHPFATRFVLH